MTIEEDYQEYLSILLMYLLFSWSEESNRSLGHDLVIEPQHWDVDWVDYVTKADVELALQSLIDCGRVYAVEDNYADTYYIVSNDTKNWIRSEEQNVDSIIGKYFTFGEDWAYTAFRKFGQLRGKLKTIESDSSDGLAWEPLPLDRELDIYRHTNAAVEEALETIEGNNGYAESEPEERQQIVSSIKEGLKQFRDGLPSRSQLVSLLVEPLRFIANKFSSAAMGEAAKIAVNALAKLLGLQ